MPIRPNDMIVGNFYTFEYEPYGGYVGDSPYRLGKYLGSQFYNGRTIYHFELYNRETGQPRMRSSSKTLVAQFPKDHIRNLNLLGNLNSPMPSFDDIITHNDVVMQSLGPDAVYPKYHADDVGGQTGGRKKRRSKKSKSKRRTRTNKRIKN